MLSTATRVKIIAFLVIGLSFIVYIGLRYAGLGRYVGLSGYYVVHVDLAETGGAFPNGDVTYRGVTVGRIGAVNLTPTGVVADLDIDDLAPRIPIHVRAVVANRSAVGEQYLDLRPRTSDGPYLQAGDTIAQQDTQTPLPVQDLLHSIDALASSVPTRSLRTVVDELDNALQGQGPNLQTLLDTSGSLTRMATDDLPRTQTLINDSQTVLHTQADEANALAAFGRNAELIAQQLDSSDPDLRAVIDNAPGAGAQVSGLLRELDGADFFDLGWSPLFNSLPVIRDRLLQAGPPRDYLMRWVDVPSLEVSASEQRYEPLGNGVVRFRAGDFIAEITFDTAGFVTSYPGIGVRP